MLFDMKDTGTVFDLSNGLLLLFPQMIVFPTKPTIAYEFPKRNSSFLVVWLFQVCTDLGQVNPLLENNQQWSI